MMVSPVCMVQVSIHELLRGLVDRDQLPQLMIGGVQSDSRRIEPGDLFIALAGLSSHAVDFAIDAVQAGAVGVLFDADDEYARRRIGLLDKQMRTQWIAVPGLPQQLGVIASRFHGHPSQAVKLVGITGTDGKTSVTHLLVQALQRLGQRVGSIGTLGYGLFNDLQLTTFTTPDAIRLQAQLAELQQAQCEFVIMEVSSHALQQFRVNGCQFDVAVLTNLGSDHLDYHGSRQSYAAAKSLLFDFPGLKTRVLNLSDPFGQELANRFTADSYIGYSASNGSAAVRLLAQKLGASGLNIEVDVNADRLHIQTGLIGDFNVDNCLACIAVLDRLGFATGHIEEAMQGLQPIPGRMEFFPATSQQPAVVIDFAHTEQALTACLSAVRGFGRGEIYCVFGCGGDRDRAKRPLMAAAAEQLADHVIVTDDNPRHEAPERIMRDILAGFTRSERVRVIHDRRAAIETALQHAGPNDLVVIAGKGHEQVQIVGDQRRAFSDQQVVRQTRGEVAQ